MDATLRPGMSRAKVPIVGPEGSGAERNALGVEDAMPILKDVSRGRMKKRAKSINQSRQPAGVVLGPARPQQ